MSTQTPAPQTPTPQPLTPAAPRHKSEKEEIKIVSHSNLFYWWPLWAVGFLLALLTLVDGHSMYIVPNDTVAEEGRKVEGLENRGSGDVLIAPQGKQFPRDTEGKLEQPRFRVATKRSYGVVFTVVLLLLIVITNVPLRGMWSVVVIVVIVFLSIIFALAHHNEHSYWEYILNAVGRLHIFINAAGYLLIALSLFVVWLVTMLLFDPQVYIVFTPGQMRVREEIGGSETLFPTAGIMVHKQRSDLFRHWILGLGSGDLVVTTSGAAAQHFSLPNVLFVGYKVRQIEDMVRDIPTVQG
jgi:hypothetical protein